MRTPRSEPGSMRHAFVDSIVELAERDESVVLLTADLGYSVLEPFVERHPERFFNVGVAEQNISGWPRAWPCPASDPSSTRLPPSPRCGHTSSRGTARCCTTT